MLLSYSRFSIYELPLSSLQPYWVDSSLHSLRQRKLTRVWRSICGLLARKALSQATTCYDPYFGTTLCVP